MLTKQQQLDWRLALQRSNGVPSADHPPEWDRKVRLEVPIGELAKPENLGLALIARSANYAVEPIKGTDRFDAQGLEGKAIILLDYVTALGTAQRLPPYRFQIREISKRRDTGS